MKNIFCGFIFFLVLYSSNLSAQTISTGLINGSPFCPGTRFTIPYTITGTFNANNVFRAQISDANGNFTNTSTVIGTLTSRVAGNISVTIPSTATASKLYRIRVVSTNPSILGVASLNSIEIKSTTACSLSTANIDDLRDVVISAPTNGQTLTYNGTNWVNSNVSGSGTVTNISVASANGLAGTVTNASSTPILNLSTTVSGIIKGDGTSFSAAVAGTDFAAALHTHSISDVNNLQSTLDGKISSNTAIQGGTKLKITYDAKGLVTSGEDANLNDLANVVLTNPSSGNILSFNGTNWVNSNSNTLAWSLNGNAGTDENQNFIGTIDDRDLNFKVYDVISGKISSKNSNTSWGRYGLVANTTGYGNTANGFKSLHSNTSGYDNSAFGQHSLAYNTTGFNNTAIGSDALNFNTIGYENTAVGMRSMYNNISGTGNSAIGAASLYSNTTGRHNTAIGSAALALNTEGFENTSVGIESLYFNTTGYNNAALGNRALYSNTSGRENIAIGPFALSTNTIGFNNIAIGFKSLEAHLSGNENVAVGGYAIRSNSTGNFNTSIGNQSLYNNSTGSENTAQGYSALQSNTSGSKNIALGPFALNTNQTGNSNTAIGYAADVSVDNLTNATAIGAGAIVNASNKLRLGNTDVTVIEGQVAMITSDGRFKNNIKEDVPGLSFIMKLKPVTYNFRYNNFSQFLKEKSSNKQHLNEKEARKEMGLIAQDVEKATKELNLNISNLVHVPENENDNYALSYGQLVVPLIKAIQEQQKTIQDLKKLVEEQGKKLESITSQKITNQSSDKAEQLSIVEDSKAPVILGQNIPNPFENKIIIPFRLPEDCKNATIVISNITNGKMIKAIPVSNKETQLNLDVSSLASGSYNYTLYINGKVVETKKMIKAR